MEQNKSFQFVNILEYSQLNKTLTLAIFLYL